MRAINRATRLYALLILAVAEFPPVAHAGINVWTRYGPPGSHEVTSLAIDPSTPSTVYAGTGGGILKSRDEGLTWESISANHSFGPVFALRIPSSTSSTIYAATGAGVFKSTDAGATWQTASVGLMDLSVTALSIDVTNESTIYAATDKGIFRSTDAGESWDAANAELTFTGVRTLAVDPKATTVVYLGTKECPQTYPNPCFGSLLKSTDAGVTWSTIFSGTVNEVVIDPQSSDVVYAVTDDALLKSTDAGVTWAPSLGIIAAALVIHPLVSSTIYVGTRDNGVFKTVDGGKNWCSHSAGLNDYVNIRALAIDPVLGTTIFAGSGNQGVFGRNDVSACGGDCDNDQRVTVDELITGVNIALGERAAFDCRVLDANEDRAVTVDELSLAISHAVSGCPPPVPVLRSGDIVVLTANQLVVRVDPQTGEQTLIAGYLVPASGFGYDPATRRLLTVGGPLQTIDVDSGQQCLPSFFPPSLPQPSLLTSIAVEESGAYVMGVSGGALLRFDPNSGATSTLAEGGLIGGGAVIPIAVQPTADGILLAGLATEDVDGRPSRVIQVDPTTGAQTLVAEITDGHFRDFAVLERSAFIAVSSRGFPASADYVAELDLSSGTLTPIFTGLQRVSDVDIDTQGRLVVLDQCSTSSSCSDGVLYRSTDGGDLQVLSSGGLLSVAQRLVIIP